MNCPLCQYSLAELSTHAANMVQFRCHCCGIGYDPTFHCFVQDKQIASFTIHKPPFFFRYQRYGSGKEATHHSLLYVRRDGTFSLIWRNDQIKSVSEAYQFIQRHYNLKAFL